MDARCGRSRADGSDDCGGFALPKKDLRNLETQLERDIRDSDEAVLERINGLIEQHLYWLIGELTGERLRKPEDITRLLHIHARARLLEKLIRDPSNFSLKEQKLLLNEITLEDQEDQRKAAKRGSVFDRLMDMDISDAQKARLVEKASEAALLQHRQRHQLPEVVDDGS